MPEREYVGCLHVHSDFSDGDVPAEDILRDAAESGLDYIMITDHRTDACRERGLTGWHGAVLCASAPEIGGRGCPHFLAFRPGDLAGFIGLEEHEALEEAHRRGAITFVAHPHPARLMLYRMPPVGWTDLEGGRFDGLEIWSYMHDVCHKVVPWRLHRMMGRHTELVRGPRPETLALWDRLCRTRRVAAVGALDNHAKRIPLLGLLLPHRALFRLLRTHLVCETLPDDGDEAERRLVRGLADGRSFIAMDGWGDAAGFRLRVEGAGLALGFGDEAPWREGLTLRVDSPLAAELAVLRDGAVIHRSATARRVDLPLDGPGVYRVEARLDGRPWVFTNPIYLRAGPAEAGSPS